MSGYNFTIVGTSGYFYNKGERKCSNSDKKKMVGIKVMHKKRNILDYSVKSRHDRDKR